MCKHMLVNIIQDYTDDVCYQIEESEIYQIENFQQFQNLQTDFENFDPPLKNHI